MMPIGTWEGWYFSEELKFAEENGYKITVYKGYNFNRVEDTLGCKINLRVAGKAGPPLKTNIRITLYNGFVRIFFFYSFFTYLVLSLYKIFFVCISVRFSIEEVSLELKYPALFGLVRA